MGNFTMIQNSMLERVIQAELPASAIRVYLYLIRKLCGWNKTSSPIAISIICIDTGIKRRSVERALSTLKEKGFISVKHVYKDASIISICDNKSCEFCHAKNGVHLPAKNDQKYTTKMASTKIQEIQVGSSNTHLGGVLEPKKSRYELLAELNASVEDDDEYV